MAGIFEQQTIERTLDIEPSEPPHIHIEPQKGWVGLQLRDLWLYRELLFFLTWRDVLIRYKQTLLGATWAIIQPVMQMIVFTIFFHNLGKIAAEGNIPYPLFNYAALLPWNYFASSLTNSSNSLVNSANLLTKVYFPRLVVPISGALSGMVDFGIQFLVLLVLMVYYDLNPAANYNAVLTPAFLTLPIFLLLALITSLGVSLWFSALNVKYRDVRYILPFLTQFWLFATPVIYPSSTIENPVLRTLFGLNPMAGVVEGFRWALLGTNPPGPMIAISVTVALVLFVTGLFYFRRVEKNFADVL